MKEQSINPLERDGGGAAERKKVNKNVVTLKVVYDLNNLWKFY